MSKKRKDRFRLVAPGGAMIHEQTSMPGWYLPSPSEIMPSCSQKERIFKNKELTPQI
jgi:hypothetical protein